MSVYTICAKLTILEQPELSSFDTIVSHVFLGWAKKQTLDIKSFIKVS